MLKIILTTGLNLVVAVNIFKIIYLRFPHIFQFCNPFLQTCDPFIIYAVVMWYIPLTFCQPFKNFRILRQIETKSLKLTRDIRTHSIVKIPDEALTLTDKPVKTELKEISAMVILDPAIHLSRVKNSSTIWTASCTGLRSSSVTFLPLRKAGLCLKILKILKREFLELLFVSFKTYVCRN